MFALFAGDDFYPSGGWRDLVSIYDSVEDALKAYVAGHFDWGHIVDLTSRKVVWDTYGLEEA